MYPIESTIGWLLLFRALISRRILGPGTTVYGLKLIIVKHMEQSVLDGGLGDYVFDYAFCICVSCQKDF